MCLDDTMQHIEVWMNSNYIRYKPRSKVDVFFIKPLHQSAINNYFEMLSNLNDIQLTIFHLERCKGILGEKSLCINKKLVFFFDHKEASNLLYWPQIQQRCGNNDVVKNMVSIWTKEKMIFSIL